MFSRSISLPLAPVFLLPPIPRRRRKTSTDLQSSISSTNSAGSLDSPTSETYLQGHTSHLRCAKCATDVCFTSQIVSKGFTGRHGRAYLISPSPTSAAMGQVPQPGRALCLPNTKTETPSQRQLVTGVHTVSDVRCAFCGSMLGWKYDGAEEESQRYKVGKYILETKMVCSSSDWEHEACGMTPSSLYTSTMAEAHNRDGGAVEFDSQDEDECEDLFAGVWTSNLALKRRQHQVFRKVNLDMEVRTR